MSIISGTGHSSKRFFNVVGKRVTRDSRPETGYKQGLEWPQAFIDQTLDFIPLTKPEGELNVNGFVAIIVDEQGRIFLNLGQEPGAANKPKYAVYRTPLQSSSAKLWQIREGKAGYDNVLATIVESIGNGETDIFKLFASGDIQLKELPLADPSRLETYNATWMAKVSDQGLIQKLEQFGAFFTLDEVEMLINAGLVNGHAVNAIAANLGFRRP